MSPVSCKLLMRVSVWRCPAATWRASRRTPRPRFADVVARLREFGEDAVRVGLAARDRIGNGVRMSRAEHHGSLELICGCMFSGKSEALLARLADAEGQGLATAAFKHVLDDRYDREEIVTHGGARRPALPITDVSRLARLAGEAQVIAIDEAQFFEPALVEACLDLVARGRTVLVAGLDRDSWGEPFGPMPALAAVADRITRTEARCAVCGAPATRTQRLAPVCSTNMIGGAESYEPRCTTCFRPPPVELRR